MTDPRTILDEIKAELDAAAIAVGAAEPAVTALGRRRTAATPAGSTPNDTPRRVVSLDDKDDAAEMIALRDTYLAMKRAANRLAMAAQVFEYGCMQMSSAAVYFQLSRYLFRSAEDIEKSPGAEQALSRLADALYRDFHASYGLGRSADIGTTWRELETIIRKLGRDI
jgi:hypothetical protein